MAEDFYSLFKLGPDNKHINPNDLASVALIAAKELQKKSDTFASETEGLKAENVDLKQRLESQNQRLKTQNERLASLEKLVINLASGDGQLISEGK